MFPNNWISVTQAGIDKTPCIKKILNWIHNEVAQPHPELLRKGDLCPFMRPSLNHNLCFMKLSNNFLLDTIIKEIKKETALFMKASPTTSEKNSSYKSLLLVFPSIMAKDFYILKKIRKQIKPYLIEKGLTCGEFYPTNNDASVRNNAIYIAQSPIPCIVLRYLSNHDVIFLKSQPELFEIYKKWKSKSNMTTNE